MRNLSFLVPVLIAGIILADIPDQTLEWDYFTVIEQTRNVEICDCLMSGDVSEFKLAVLSETDSKRELWLIELDSYGNVLRRTSLIPDIIDQAEWVLPVFTDDSTIVIACGFNSEGRSIELRIADLSDPDVWRTVSLSSLLPDDVSLRITSIEPSDSSVVLLAGSSLSSSGTNSLFAAAIDMDGREIWSSIIEMDRQGGLSDITEMLNGNILCSGFGRTDEQFAYRGIMICLDPSGEELWRREDWYLDHTSFVYAQTAAGGRLILTGWAGITGDFGSDVTDMDVLFAEVDTGGEWITGYLVTEPGDQKPCCVFSTEEGEFLVIGEHTVDETDGSNMFLGRLLVTLREE